MFEVNFYILETQIRNVVRIKILLLTLCYSFDHLSVIKIINLGKEKDSIPIWGLM